MILKGIKFTGKVFKKTKKPKSKKRYKTQFEDTDDYGLPSVRNVMYRSGRGLKAQRKYMDKKFKSQGSSKWGTFPLSKSNYKSLKKSEKGRVKKIKIANKGKRWSDFNPPSRDSKMNYLIKSGLYGN
jgi:hypothetical protein